MGRNSRDLDLRELAASKPDVNKLREEFLWAVQRRDANVFARQRENYQARLCIWAGQSRDGRKWGTKDKEPFPWVGASDARVPLIDQLINEDVAKLMVAWKRNKILVSGTESNDDGFATRLTQVLKWMVFTQMKEARREARLGANFLLERGAMVMGVFWERRMQLGYEEVDLESIQGMAMQMGASERGSVGASGAAGAAGAAGLAAAGDGRSPGLPEGLEPAMLVGLPEMIMDPTREGEAAEIAALVYPDTDRGQLRKAVRDLRTTGKARFARPYVKRDRPRLMALALNEEVFLPPEATGIDDELTGLDRRELLSETTLRERVGSMGWDEGWVEEVIKTQRGRITGDIDGSLLRRGTAGLAVRGLTDMSRLFEVVHGYRRRGDVNGVPGIYCTYFSPGLTESRRVQNYGWSGLLDYDHGEYPFVLFEREGRSRLVDESRGYGEIGGTWQQQVKTEWDSRTDRSSIATCPPSFYPVGSAPERWGPGVRIGTHRPDDYGFLKTPQYDPMSKEVEGTVERFAKGYFGRVIDPEAAVEAGAMQQELADNWMWGWGMVYTQNLQLMQQFMPDEFFYRVVGSSKGQPIHASREDIQGEFDVHVGMSMDDLDPEKVKEKLGLVEQALQMDVNGQVDRSEALTVVFEMIDPNMGERLLQPAEAASAKEVDDEKVVFAQLRAGIPVDVKPSGQAYRLRLQVLQQLMQSNPSAQQQYQGDPQFKAVLEKRVKQLTSQVQQHEVNPLVGRLGG